jgi:hypothetical protein
VHLRVREVRACARRRAVLRCSVLSQCLTFTWSLCSAFPVPHCCAVVLCVASAYLPLTLAEREAIARAARDGRDLLKDSLDARPTVPEPAAGLSYDAELDNWYLGPEGSVHHAGGVTSRVSAVDGRIVTTAAYGSRYRLLTVRREVEHMLQRIGMAFDPENPLLNASSLVYAWTAHSLEAEMRDAARLLRGVESKLSPFGGSVRECFATVFKAFAALGFPDAEHAAET